MLVCTFLLYWRGGGLHQIIFLCLLRLQYIIRAGYPLNFNASS